MFVLLLYVDSYGAKVETYLSDVIEKLSRGTIQIVYSNDFIKANEIIVDKDIHSTNSLNDFLNEINYELFEVQDSIYLIRPNQPISQKSSPPITIGNILDQETGYQILDAQIILAEDSSVLTENQASGYVILNLTSGDYNIIIKAKGYISQSDILSIDGELITLKDYVLLKAPEELENLYVTTSLYDFHKTELANQNILNSDDLNSSPHLGNDPARAIVKLPGLTSSGLSARLHVRGGKQNESQVVLNGFGLRNPYHFKDFFGVFSVINLSYVDELSLYTGVFPAKYGNYISSIMDIQSITPSDDFFVNASLGVFNSYVTFGKSFDAGSEYLISYRSGGDLFRTDLLRADLGNPSYNDLFLHYTHQFDDGTTIQSNILYSADAINLNLVNEDEVANAKYNDNSYWISLNKPISDELSLKGMFFYQSNNSGRYGELLDDESQGTLFEDRTTNYYGVSASIDNKLSENAAFSLGISLQKEMTNIQFETQLIGADFISELLNPNNIDFSRIHDFQNEGYRTSLHGNLRYKFNTKFYGDFGLRVDSQTWISQDQVSPRINLSYFYDESLIFRLGIGRHFQEQYIDGILLEDQNPAYFAPEFADIGVFEIQKQLNKSYSLRSEFYYKKYHNVQPYYENLFIRLNLNPELFSDRVRIEPESAFSRGLDLSLNGAYTQFNWSVSYSYSEAKDIINGLEYPRSWDQQNAIKLGFDWFGNNWQLNSLFQYHTGWPRTVIEAQAANLVIGNRNATRNKPFLNLNFKFSYDFTFKGSQMKYWIQLNNAFDRENQCCLEYDYEMDDTGQFLLTEERKEWLPFLPSIGIDMSF
ncbi:MAG: hypothetical protein L3J52_05295 [Proteobacteria bacterium]|nr:hypothetical protein [Pseudomonadota bacterium]